MTAEGCGKGSLNFKFSLVPVSGDSPCVSNSEASSRLCPMWFAREKPRKAARSIEHCRQPRAFGGLVLQFSISKNRRVLWRGQAGQHCKPQKMQFWWVALTSLTAGQGQEKEKQRLMRLLDQWCSKTARKLYRVRVILSYTIYIYIYYTCIYIYIRIYMNMEVKKFSE